MGEVVSEELQREVYRRRRVMYELSDAQQGGAQRDQGDVRPEMIVVVHDGDGAYECRVFYKEPRPAGAVEQIRVEAGWQSILGLRSDPDPVVRLASEKVEEFHGFRQRYLENGEPAPERRVFYANGS